MNLHTINLVLIYSLQEQLPSLHTLQTINLVLIYSLQEQLPSLHTLLLCNMNVHLQKHLS